MDKKILEDMKLGFNIYDITTNDYKVELSVEEAGLIVDAFADRKDLGTAKEDLKIPRKIIANVYSDISEIESMIIRIMKGEATVQFEEKNSEGDITTPKVYNEIPVDLDSLKELAFNLIARDYAKKVQAAYTIEQIEDLRLKVYYCIDKLVQYSKLSKDGNWAFFSQQF